MYNFEEQDSHATCTARMHCQYSAVSFPDHFLHTEGKNSPVNGIFRSGSLRRNVGGAISCESEEIHGINGDRES